MDTDDVAESTLRLQSSLQKFIYHVDELGNRDDPTGDGFTAEFKEIRDFGLRMREENTYPADEGRKPCNIKKNRYKDILPFDATRVLLDEIPGEEGSDYVNANFIEDLNGFKSYIASQGPVPLTVYDFWRMILQYKVKVIAMACRTVELGKKKCEEYWPSEVNETIEFKDISVTLIANIELAEHCTRRELRVTKPGCDNHIVTQFHYTGWPDHDIPHDFDVILEMIAEMREIKQQDTNKAPMVIHCSAGCGRTGTICAIDYSWDLLKSGKLDEEFSLYDIVMRMREQRQSMIQAPEQYRMAHVTVQTLFQKHLDLMEDHTYGNLNFEDGAEVSEQQGGENVYSYVSDAGSEASSLGVPSHGQRKDSSLSHEIASTIAKATHNASHDDTAPTTLQKPLTPVAVYEAEPKVKDLCSVFSKVSSESAKTFPVEQIENIPTLPIQKYVEHVSKQDAKERPLSYMPSESKKQDLESTKKLFESGQKSAPEPAKAYVVKSSTETNNNKPIPLTKKPESVTRPQSERIHSTQTDRKHITVLNVGGGNRAPVKQTMSAPDCNVSKSVSKSRSSTLPDGKVNNHFYDSPQSSVPPIAPSQPTESHYSYAGKSSFFTNIPNDNASVKSSTSVNNTTNGSAPYAYSELSSCTSGTYSVSAADPYSVVGKSHVGQGHVGNQLNGPDDSSSQAYSYATEPVPGGNVYSSVNKSGKPTQNHQGHDVYETVGVGNISRDKNAPPVPTRGYNEDDSDRPGDTSTLGRKAQLTSAVKKLFTTKGVQNSTSDVVVPSDLPPYLVKIGRIPSGPRDQPISWRKK